MVKHLVNAVLADLDFVAKDGRANGRFRDFQLESDNPNEVSLPTSGLMTRVVALMATGIPFSQTSARLHVEE